MCTICVKVVLWLAHKSYQTEYKQRLIRIRGEGEVTVAFRGFTEPVQTNSCFRNSLKGTYSTSKVAISCLQWNGETKKKKKKKNAQYCDELQEL
jgi:hypothetical protein